MSAFVSEFTQSILQTRIVCVCARGSTEDIEVHHIRKLADLNVKGRKEKPVWVQIMATRRRKTLVVCHNCHVQIHNGAKS